jgi:ABC-type Fe3+/spermidine/putrescine transport system ATPase subunit
MNAGRIEQMGRPHEIYRKPQSLFVARFVGDANVVEGVRRDGSVTLDGGPKFQSDGSDGRVTFVLRPEDIRLGVDSVGSMQLRGTIKEAVHLGGSARVIVVPASGHELLVNVADPDAVLAMAPGMTVALSWAERAMVEVAP